MRTNYKLNEQEIDKFHRLRPLPEQAFEFWREVAVSRGLDPVTVLHVGAYVFSALPYGHGCHWCWPANLRIEG